MDSHFTANETNETNETNQTQWDEMNDVAVIEHPNPFSLTAPSVPTSAAPSPPTAWFRPPVSLGPTSAPACPDNFVSPPSPGTANDETYHDLICSSLCRIDQLTWEHKNHLDAIDDLKKKIKYEYQYVTVLREIRERNRRPIVLSPDHDVIDLTEDD